VADTILVVNAGSSSIKFQLFEVLPGDRLDLELKGQLEGIGSRPRLVARDGTDRKLIDDHYAPGEVVDVATAIDQVEDWLTARLAGVPPLAIGHRVVHGGSDYARPRRVDAAVLAQLEALASLAPLHQPNNLMAIRQVLQRFPQIPQVACFDTAFHRGHPEVADRYALPESFYREGIRRYGFHGLSYEYIAHRLEEIDPALAAGRVVACHLGSGASMCAIQAGKSLDSTMGFTALDGLPMGTRTGQLDPGIVLHLVQAKGYDAPRLERLLYHESGLKGLSGVSNDVRDLLASKEPSARLALDYFVYRAAREIGGLAAAMGGLDGIVFTAGIGENAPAIRAWIAARLGWLGLELDHAANERHGPLISTTASRLKAYVVSTNEELMIARHTLAVLRGAG
jgi:acetate kinase